MDYIWRPIVRLLCIAFVISKLRNSTLESKKINPQDYISNKMRHIELWMFIVHIDVLFIITLL